MARKTFISYKYSEAKGLRDKILKAMGDDATYYNGETKDSPDMTENADSTIEKTLKDMIYGTSVTIVIISPNMRESEWIDWEIKYSLKEILRADKTSKTNGVVGVVMKFSGGYGWFIEKNVNCHGTNTLSYQLDIVPEIISDNTFNKKSRKKHCDKCNTYIDFDNSYIHFITEEDFLANPNSYVEEAYNKSKNIDDYELSKQ